MMDYWPNIEGMKWFIESVFPRVRASFPAVRLRIVGGRPGRDVRRWGEDPNIEVTGFVPDVREYVARADVCIAPLRVARGIQNKVLEAMAMGKSVVCTSGAYEGISADPRSDLCVADTEQAFAEAIISLLKDPDRASELGRSARQFAEQTYSWEANLRRLDELLEAPQAKDHGQRYDKGHAIARG
jgi:glycosyltransferase involved in cell wall biosynthesis